MLWGEDILRTEPAAGVTVEVVAGTIGGHVPPPPPPDSSASCPGSHLAIWVIHLEPGAGWVLPTAPGDVNRMLHCFRGDVVDVANTCIETGIGARLAVDATTRLTNRGESAELLLLQGRPIAPPFSRWAHS